MKIRRAEKKDIPKIAELVSKVMTPQLKKVGDSFMDLELYKKSLEKGIEVLESLDVVEDKKKIIGFMHYYYEDNEAFVQDFVVDPKHQGKGIGKLMMCVLMENMERGKIGKVTYYLPYGSPNLKFAEKFGFKAKAIELRKEMEVSRKPVLEIKDMVEE